MYIPEYRNAPNVPTFSGRYGKESHEGRGIVGVFVSYVENQLQVSEVWIVTNLREAGLSSG